jgi:hypothetical protein
MSPTLRAIFFEGMGFVALWSVIKDISTGNATSRGITINVRENPGGFYLIVFFKAGLVSFAIAIILHALRLIDDPFAWMQQNLPFLVPR